VKGEENLKRKKSTGEYLAFLCVKYELSPDMLFCALLAAGENGEAKCGNLSIECRGKMKDRAVFLIMDGAEVVAQFSVPRNFLLQQGNPIRTFMGTDIVRRHINREPKPVYSCAISDLRAGMCSAKVEAKVLEVTKPKLVTTRYGNNARLAKAVLADETGKIKLCLWNDQIDAVSPGDTVQIENARVSMFSGEKQLSLGKKGTLNNIDDLERQQMAMDLPPA
jgi:replication factor A1